MGWQTLNNTGDKISTIGKGLQSNAFATTTDLLGSYQGGVYAKRNWSPKHSPYNNSTIVVTRSGSDAGGFSFHTLSYASSEFYVVLNAKMPIGVEIVFATNRVGAANGGYATYENRWLTPVSGTGDWEVYVHYVKAYPAGQSGGIYSTTNFFYFDRKEDFTEVCEISSAQVYDATGLGLNKGTVLENMTKSMTYTYGASNQTLVALWEEDTWLEHADTAWQGEGTEASPYIIDSAEKLAGISYAKKYKTMPADVYFKQTANINLGGHNWYPIGKHRNGFNATYDGNGYTISGMYIDTDEGVTGLFGDVEYGHVRNINLKNSTIRSVSSNDNDSCGSIVGILDNDASMYNCHSDAKVYCNGAKVGGLIGWNWYDAVDSCTFSGTVEGFYQVGGIIGCSTGGTIVNCINTGKVVSSKNANGDVGGIVGNAGYDGTTTINNCISNGTVEGPGCIGSITGSGHDVNLNNCAGAGQIVCNGQIIWIGGVIGYREGTINMTNCSFVGSINIDNTQVTSWTTTNGTLNVDSCYSLINGKGVYTNGVFEDFAVCIGMNDDLPMQKALYHVANVAPTKDIIEYLKSKNFTK